MGPEMQWSCAKLDKTSAWKTMDEKHCLAAFKFCFEPYDNPPGLSKFNVAAGIQLKRQVVETDMDDMGGSLDPEIRKQLEQMIDLGVLERISTAKKEIESVIAGDVYSITETRQVLKTLKSNLDKVLQEEQSVLEQAMKSGKAIKSGVGRNSAFVCTHTEELIDKF